MLGGFAGASLAMLTGRDEELERYAARGSVWGGLAGIALELSTLLGRAIGPAVGGTITAMSKRTLLTGGGAWLRRRA